MRRLRVHLARLLTRLAVCPGGCRQSPGRCTCAWLPPLPDEWDPDLAEGPDD